MAQHLRRGARVVGIGVCVLLLSGPAFGQTKDPGPPPPDAGVRGDELVGPGYRREHVTRLERATPQRIQSMLDAGKPVDLDPATGQRVVKTLVDHLPAGWVRERPADLAPGARIDSFGDPIVNDAPGLPAWAQRDVDALRAAIAEWRGKVAQQRAGGIDAREAEGVLGNFVAQALVRSIAIDDIVNIDDASMVTPGVAASILGTMHFYENARFANQDLFHYQYTPTAYPDRVAAFVGRHGSTLQAVQAIEAGTMAPRGPGSGCYTRATFARGMTNLSGQTDIWSANGFDDESADIPTGMELFFFYGCAGPANNDMVRVSTNGYITFFQQGGGALDGTDFTNDAIPDAADPDGYAAPWWDDLFVATAQGNTDRVSYKTEGTVGARVFTVEWFSMSRLGGDTTDFHFFQVKLYETSDVIELHYGLDVSGWNADAADNATSGLENYAGDAGHCGPNCTNTNALPPPNDYRFAPAPRPGNDDCAGAVELINGASVTGSLMNATADGDASCGGSSVNRDVWYTFVAPCNGTLHADTCGSRDIAGPTTGVDTVLSVHSGCGGTTANQLACNDDSSVTGCSGNDSSVSVAMTAGQRVYLRVTHFGDLAFRFANGQFNLHLNFVSTSAPANDDCASAATILNGNTLVGNLTCASNDGSSDCGASATNPDAWYRFTAGPRAGVLTISLCGSRDIAGADTGPDTVLSLHTGCPGTVANERNCNDDGLVAGCDVLDSTASVALLGGQSVRIRVSHFGSSAFRVGNGLFAVHASFRCGADFNMSGSLTVQDIFDFLAAWFAGCAPPIPASLPSTGPCQYGPADFNGDTALSVQDIFDFLAAWFAGCP